MPGFFTKTKSFRPQTTIPRCGQCGLYKHCESPKMPVSGRGERKILIVAEAPGKEEDRQNTQLVGQSGQRLRAELDDLGVDLDRDCWKTNALICRPAKNRTPTDAEISHCLPNLLNAIEELKPETIILLGDAAVRSLIGFTWKANPGPIGRWIGWKIPDQKLNAWICPMWHPAYLLRENRQYAKADPRLIWFRHHLKAAVELDGRPWNIVPRWEEDVRIEMDSQEAVGLIDKMHQYPMVAVDYETNMLKPDAPDAAIVVCSVAGGDSDGPWGIVAYPWTKAAAAATGRLMRSPVKKIIANKGFEIRWTSKEFGHGIRNVAHDTMHDAHLLDNRRDISSVKFQAYVLLGQPEWDSHIKPYLKADNSNTRNRIHEIPMRDLLLYCGLDSLLEFRIALKQRELLAAGVV